jgi:quercetin dioxygenase-like cupin family protein
MGDSTVKKVQSDHSPVGAKGQTYLVSGKGVSLRLWKDEAPTKRKSLHANDYETVGFVLAGQAALEIENQTIVLQPGDAWLVPAGAEHRYEVQESFSALEATSPPAEFHGRDE